MKARILVVVLLLTSSIALVHPGPVSVKAASAYPSFVVLFASFNGWNSSCTGTPGCTSVNPGFTESVGGKFTVSAQFDDTNTLLNHDFAIYTNGTTAGSVNTGNTCSTSNANGCLAKTVPINYINNPAANLTFTPLQSAETANLGGTAGFEYFCQYHPFSMHGHITISRNLVLMANINGWNSTGGNVNPGFKEFTGAKFRVNAQFNDFSGIFHDFAIYTNATTPGSVSAGNSCSTGNTNGCLARTAVVSANSPTANLNFTALLSELPPNFGGLGGFEYFCQYHPSSMHGHITVYKNPDVTGPNGTPDHIDNILDIALIAFAFGSKALPTPTPTWNAAADLDNNGVVNILDVALAAFYFGQTF